MPFTGLAAALLGAGSSLLAPDPAKPGGAGGGVPGQMQQFQGMVPQGQVGPSPQSAMNQYLTSLAQMRSFEPSQRARPRPVMPQQQLMGQPQQGGPGMGDMAAMLQQLYQQMGAGGGRA